MITDTLMANAREVIQRTKAMHLRGEIVPADQMLAFALADVLIAAPLAQGDIAILLKCIDAEAANMQFSATPKERLDLLREKLKTFQAHGPKQAQRTGDDT